MSTELTTEKKELSAAQMIALMQEQGKSKHATEKALSTVTKVGNYLPYIQLHGSNSKIVKRGQFKMGNFALTKSKVNHDLGDSFITFAISWRPKAMQYKPTVLSVFDIESAQFKAIEAKDGQKDSNCGFGAEFLLWLPEHKELATLFLGNATGRNEAPNLISSVGSACRIGSVLIENKKYEWHGAKVFPYDLPVNVWPDGDFLAEELKKFNNPPASTTDVAEKDDSEEGRG